ncbi:hypothetical protein HK098_006828 [Nowakowskiella sp. JEL0407]|nr:hypothetical protein HK098_006828 [Nowakowskiella sp. JEL0407]
MLTRGSQSVVPLIQLALKRVNELLSQLLKRRLEVAVALLSKETPLLVTATKFLISSALTGSGRASMKVLQHAIEIIIAACIEIETVVLSNDENEYSGNSVSKLGFHIETVGKELFSAVQEKKSAKEIQDCSNKYGSHIKKLIEWSKGILSNIPSQTAAVREKSTKIERITQKIEDQVQILQSTPTETENYAKESEKLSNLLDKNAECIHEELLPVLSQGLIAEFMDLSATLSDVQNENTIIGKLSNSINYQHLDQKLVKSAISDFEKCSQRLNDVTKSAGILLSAADKGEDITQKLEDITSIQKNLQSIAKNEILSAEAVAELSENSPAKSYGVENFNHVTDLWIKQTKELGETVLSNFDPKDILSAARDNLENCIAEYYDAVESGKIVNVDQFKTAYLMAAREFIGLLASEKMNSDDKVYSETLKSTIEELQPVINKLSTNLTEYFTASNDKIREEIKQDVLDAQKKFIQGALVVAKHHNFENDWLSESNNQYAESEDIEKETKAIDLFERVISSMDSKVAALDSIQSKKKEAVELIRKLEDHRMQITPASESEIAKLEADVEAKLYDLETSIIRELIVQTATSYCQLGLKEDMGTINYQLDRKLNGSNSVNSKLRLESHNSLQYFKTAVTTFTNSVGSLSEIVFANHLKRITPPAVFATNLQDQLQNLTKFSAEILPLAAEPSGKGNVKSMESNNATYDEYYSILVNLNQMILVSDENQIDTNLRIQGLWKSMEKTIESINKSLETVSENQFDLAAANVVSVIPLLHTILRNQSKPELSNQLDAIQSDFGTLRSHLNSASNELFQNLPKAIKDREQIKKLISNIKKRFGAIVIPLTSTNEEAYQPEIIETDKEEVSDRDEVLQLAIDMGEIVLLNEEAPVLLSITEAQMNPIKAAAQEIKVQAATWVSEKNPIVEAAQNVSNGMLELAARHQLLLRHGKDPVAKKEFLEQANNIITWATKMATKAKLLSSKCTDKRLRSDLEKTCDRISTLASQFKIIAAVKASNPGDPDRDAQLINCTQNITNAVKNCLKSCEGASLKVTERSDNIIIFRKIHYQKKYIQ